MSSPINLPKLRREMSSVFVYPDDKCSIKVPLKHRLKYEEVLRELKISIPPPLPLLLPCPLIGYDGDEYFRYSCGVCGTGLTSMFSDCC